MLKINKYLEERVALYSPDNVKLGDVNQDELLDFRVQIATNKVEGYYILHANNEKTTFDSEGEVDSWHNDTFETTIKLVMKLRRIQKQNNNEQTN